MKTVSELLRVQSTRPVVRVAPGDSVLEAIKVLAREDVGAAVVLDVDRLAGIFSERDYTRKVILQGRSSDATRVHEIMTANVICVPPTASIRDCMALMVDKGIRHLPVRDGDRVASMVSIRDIVGDLVADHEFTISQLQNYING